jgi:hypothetical protein
MGRFDSKFDDEVTRREAERDERDQTKHVENDAALPLYERVMPILERARRELEPKDITVDFSPELSLPHDRQHLRFQLICNKNGARSSVYRLSLNAKHGQLRAHKCEPSRKRGHRVVGACTGQAQGKGVEGEGQGQVRPAPLFPKLSAVACCEACMTRSGYWGSVYLLVWYWRSVSIFVAQEFGLDSAIGLPWSLGYCLFRG